MMIYEGEISCPVCSGELKYYDHVHRIMKGKEGTKQIIEVRRMQCKKCHKIHRELPDEILPYLHYERDIVVGVYNGWITPETLGFEDYPSETTMSRWHGRLFKLEP